MLQLIGEPRRLGFSRLFVSVERAAVVGVPFVQVNLAAGFDAVSFHARSLGGL